MNDEENPWSANHLDDFLFYNCPECDFKEHSKDFFVKHALNLHPRSKEKIGGLLVKQEFIENPEEEENYYSNNDYMDEKPEIAGQDYQDFIDDDNYDYDEFLEPPTSKKIHKKTNKKIRSKNKKKWSLDLICALVVKHQIFKDKNKLRIRLRWKEAHKEYFEKTRHERTWVQLSKKWQNLVQMCKSRQLKVKSGNYSSEPDLTHLELKVLEVHNIQYEDNQDNNYHNYTTTTSDITNNLNLEQKPVITSDQDTNNDFNEEFVDNFELGGGDDEYLDDSVQIEYRKYNTGHNKSWNLDLICALVVKHQIFIDKNKVNIRLRWKRATQEYVEKSKHERTWVQLSKKWQNMVHLAKSRRLKVKSQGMMNDDETGNKQECDNLTLLEIKILDTVNCQFEQKENNLTGTLYR